MSICKNGINNPKHAYEHLAYETQVICNSKVQLEKLIATKIHIERNAFNEHSVELHSLFVQQQNFMYEILSNLELHLAEQIPIEVVNTQDNIIKINNWFSIIEKIHARAIEIEELSRKKLEQEL
ncbi:hypothetical protein [Shewanella sp. UCD-KL12]|uniref:hypothetical protein n=1 Tax=Shewanella sp. UCD-KL12 TaxID=1917163 RepID=UPI000970F1F9|nr:hypothetical protein [Shewanella sp. UCD-KL12]